MKRAEQKEINRVAMEIFDNAILELNRIKGRAEWKRLRTCTAEVAETENYYILRSYDTLVACIVWLYIDKRTAHSKIQT